jgi:long-chain acyl-CoA synthetase
VFVREFSVPAMVEVPDSANLTDAPFARAETDPGQIVLRRRSGSAWSAVTAREFTAEVTAVAKGLIAAGLAPGDRVALMSRTRYEWTLLDYAIWAAGGVAVPIYETSSAEQVAWILADSAARAAFVETSAHLATLTEAREQAPGLEHVWTIDDDAVAELTRLGADVSDDTFGDRRRCRSGADLATLVYTSGTTGRPKGCELTHANFVETSRNAIEGALREIAIDGASTLLFLPLAHVFARLIQVLCVESGVVLAHGDIPTLQEDLASYRPTFLLAVPRVFEKVYNAAEQQAIAGGKGKIFAASADTAIAYSRALDTASGPGLGLKLKHRVFDKLVYGKLRAAVGGQMTYAVSGGAALGERLGHFFRGVGIIILEGYGLTETTAPATVNRPSKLRIGTVGQPLPGVSVRIAEDGEVQVKGVNVLQGYWHNETAGKEALEDGWFRTGDLGELDADGFLKITGRKKEILVTAAGKNVAPAPLEDRVRAHPLVSQCLVVGDGRKFISALITLDDEALGPWGQAHGKGELTVPQALADPDVLAAIESAVAAANKSVSNAEAIKKYKILEIDFTEETGHLTPSFKVKRNVVTRDYAAEIDALYR